MKKNTQLYLLFWLIIMVILAIISIFIYLKIEIVEVFLAALIILLIIISISLLSGKVVVSNQQWALLRIYGINIELPLKEGTYYIFPYLGITNCMIVSKQYQEITVNKDIKFLDYSTTLQFVLTFRIDDIDKASTLIDDSNKSLFQFIEALFHPSVGSLRFFLSQLYLKQAVGIKHLCPLKLAAINTLPIDTKSIAHLLFNYETYKSFPLGYEELREIVNENGERNILPCFKELNRLFSESMLYSVLKKHGISILKMDILGFDQAIAQLDEDLRKKAREEEIAKRQKREEEERALRKSLAEEAKAAGKNVCMGCYAIEPNYCCCDDGSDDSSDDDDYVNIG